MEQITAFRSLMQSPRLSAVLSVIVLLALWSLKHGQFYIVAGRGSRKNMDAKIQPNIPTQIQYSA